MSRRSRRKNLARIDFACSSYGLQPQSTRRWGQVLDILGANCLKCDSPNITRDHIVPLTRGGLNHPANLQPLCRHCNQVKGDAIIDYRSDEQRAAVLRRWPLPMLRALAARLPPVKS